MSGSARPAGILDRLRQRRVRYPWYAALIVLLASQTWRKWPDIVGDFGHELYGAWRVSEGAVPFRDLATLYGPLSLCFNGLVFRLAGVSFTSLIGTNLLLLFALAALVNAYFEAAAGAVAATVAATLLLVVFGFGQYLNTGSYNFVAPYSHAATHALILAIAMAGLLVRWVRRPGRAAAGAAGSCLGLVALAKPETAGAAAVAAAVAFLLARRMGREVAGGVVLFVAGALAPLAAAFLLFLRVLPARAAVHATLGAFGPVPSAVGATSFFARVMGLDHPVRNGAIACAVFAGLALLAAIGLLGDRASRNRPRLRPWLAAALAGGLVLLLTARPLAGAWTWVARPLPIVAAAFLAWSSVRLWRSPLAGDAPRLLALAVWAAFSLAILGRILLKAEVGHFGFVLALPAAMLLALAFMEVLPGLALAWGGGLVARACGLAFLVSFGWVQLRLTAHYDDPKDFVLGSGGDGIVVVGPEVSSRTAACLLALQRIEALLPPGGTMAAVPHGAFLNYLSRRRNPTPYVLISPPQLANYEEATMLAAYRKAPPDLVLFVHSDASEFGLEPFGEEPRNGALFMAWVRSEYRLEETIVADPRSYERFGIQVFTRRGNRGGRAAVAR